MDGKESKARGSSSDRMLSVLDRFTADSPAWTVEDLQVELECSRATTYRYVRALVEVGLLAAAAGGTYVLGPRIIELDRQIRLCDPLVIAAKDVMVRVKEEMQANLMLCSFYGDKVMSVHQEWVDPKIESSYERGRPMPLFRGATAKTILANLPTYQQRALLQRYGEEIAEAGLGKTWDEFRKHLKGFRQDHALVSWGEIDPTLVGIGAPIFFEEGQVTGSLSFIVRSARLGEERVQGLRRAVSDAAAEISGRLGMVTSSSATGQYVARPPRRGS